MDRLLTGVANTISVPFAIAIVGMGCGEAVLEQTYQSRVVKAGQGEITVRRIQSSRSDQSRYKTYPVLPDARITKDGKGASLQDLKPGDFVNLKTTQSGDRETVTEIEAQTAEPKKKEPAKERAKKKEQAKKKE